MNSHACMRLNSVICSGRRNREICSDIGYIKGALLGEKLREQLDDKIDLYAKARGALHSETSTYDNLSVLVDAIFDKYDGLVFIMAAGIVVRVIAAHIRDKRYDPAVVVMDDAGIHAISLLSGHLGGANELTEKWPPLLAPVRLLQQPRMSPTCLRRMCCACAGGGR